MNTNKPSWCFVLFHLQLQEKLTLEKEQAVEEARAEARDLLQDLENRYAGIVERLQAIGPVLSEFVESYILLQREVKTIPKIIKQTVTKVKKEVSSWARHFICCFSTATTQEDSSRHVWKIVD